MVKEKESAPSSLAYSLSSRRQTGLQRYTRKGYSYQGVSQSREVVASLVGDYLKVNLIRILNTQLSALDVLQSGPHPQWSTVSTTMHLQRYKIISILEHFCAKI